MKKTKETVRKAAKKRESFWGRIGIGNKCVLIACVIVASVLFAILNIYYENNKEVLLEYTQDHARQELDGMVQKLENIFDAVQNVSTLLVLNERIQTGLRLEDPREIMNMEYTLHYTMDDIVENFDFISSIVLYKRDGGSIGTSRVNVANIKQNAYENLSKKFEEMDTDMMWEDMHVNECHIFKAEQNALTFRRNIISLYTRESLGYLEINVNEKIIAEIYQGEESEETKFLMVNDEGVIVSAGDKALIYQKLDEAGNFDTDGDFTFYGSRISYSVVEKPLSEIGGWRLYCLNTLKTTQKKGEEVFLFTFTVGVAGLLLIGGMLAVAIRGVIQPIVQLSEVMDGSEEDILYKEQTIEYRNQDEAGRLIRSFQSLRWRIWELMEKNEKEQREKAKLEIFTLQAQINPHFLYNTLDSVCALIQMKKNTAALDMLKSIELFYRGSLSGGKLLVSLQEELFIAREYIKIQQYRYEGNLEVEIQCSEEAMDAKIPKLTLQPILENAIYHGLNNGGRDGKIWIRECHDEDKVVIVIEDNGKGFSEQKSNIRPGKKGGYGILNTRNRLQSYFGSEYGIEIDSVVGKGTKVFISIPYGERSGEE